MGDWRTEHPVENGSFPDDSVDWMDTPEGQQSIEALDLVFGALDHVDVDARQRKIVWTDGKRLSIEAAAERLHAASMHHRFTVSAVQFDCRHGLVSQSVLGCREAELGSPATQNRICQLKDELISSSIAANETAPTTWYVTRLRGGGAASQLQGSSG